jgi:hypothetical protein
MFDNLGVSFAFCSGGGSVSRVGLSFGAMGFAQRRFLVRDSN